MTATVAVNKIESNLIKISNNHYQKSIGRSRILLTRESIEDLLFKKKVIWNTKTLFLLDWAGINPMIFG